MKYIYNSPIPEAAQTDERDRLGKQLAEAGILDEDNTAVKSLSSQAADLTLAGQYRWGEEISEMLATELDELSDSSLPALPLYRRGGGYSNAGYYEIESADIEPLHANDRSVWSFTLSLTSAGKKGSYYRSVETGPYKADHEFGNGMTALVGIPSTATKVQWFHSYDKTRTPATSLEERATAAADVAIYDLTDAPWYDPPPFDEGTPPTLIYKVDYNDEVPCGVRVYDTRGYDAKFTTEGIRQWQTIHSTEHDIDQPVVLSNALIRLRLDEAAGTIAAEEWDSASSSWTDVGLTQPSGVSLFDVDLLEVAMVRDKAQLTFDVGGDLFALDAILSRGSESVLFTIPDGESGPIPTEVENWVGPVASSTLVDPNASKALVSRSEVSR